MLKGRDGILREVTIKYCNSGEQHLSLGSNSSKDKKLPRHTERTVRKIVQIFSVEEASLAEDFAELKKKMEQMPDDFLDTDQSAGMGNVVASS